MIDLKNILILTNSFLIYEINTKSLYFSQNLLACRIISCNCVTLREKIFGHEFIKHRNVLIKE